MRRFLFFLLLISFCAQFSNAQSLRDFFPGKKHEKKKEVPVHTRPQTHKVIVVDSVTGKANIVTQNISSPKKTSANHDTVKTNIQFSKKAEPVTVQQQNSQPLTQAQKDTVKTPPPAKQSSGSGFTVKSGTPNVADSDKSSVIKLDLQPQATTTANTNTSTTNTTIYYSPRYNYNPQNDNAAAQQNNKTQNNAAGNNANTNYSPRYNYNQPRNSIAINKKEPVPAKKELVPEKREVFIEEPVREPIIIPVPKNHPNHSTSSNFPRDYSSVEKKKRNPIIIGDDNNNTEEDEDYSPEMTLTNPRLSVEIRVVQSVVRDINELKFFVTITNNSSKSQRFLFDKPIKKGFAIWGASCRINGSKNDNVLTESGKAEYNVKSFSSAKYDHYAITIKPFEWFIKKFSVADIVVLNDEVCKDGHLPEDRYTLQLILQGNYSNVVSFSVRR